MSYIERRERNIKGKRKLNSFLYSSHSHKNHLSAIKGIDAFFLSSQQEISEIFKAKFSFRMLIPFFDPRVQAGVPSPIAEFTEGTLDLNEHLIKNKEATFFVRVVGESMIGASIFPGDLLVVDRIMKPVSGKIIIALLNGGLTVKRLRTDKNIIILCAENESYPDIKITKADDFSIWGVVTNVIHSLE